MSALSIQPPFPIFTETDGQPLENGYIWLGTINLNPIVNPISAYWDAALTIAAVQPIRTLNGYPVYQGTPARIYVNSNYSIQVQNRNGSIVEVSAEAAPGRVAIRGPEGALNLPANAAPLSWWEPQRFGGAVPIFGTTTGRLMDLRWSRLALPGGGVQWRCQGEVDATLAYDANGQWVAYSVIGDDGSTVSYTAS
jgi:hypothetical protein